MINTYKEISDTLFSDLRISFKLNNKIEFETILRNLDVLIKTSSEEEFMRGYNLGYQAAIEDNKEMKAL